MIALAAEAQAAFFSYSRDDSEFAFRLAKDLKSAGANVWLDQVDIAPGEEWDSAVEVALDQSPHMLLILSPSSVKSRNVRNEITFALNKQERIIPILYQDCEVPLQLLRVQHIDFRSDYASGLKTLLETLAAEQPLKPGAGDFPTMSFPHGETKAAEASAEDWLKLVDSGDYAKSWHEASPTFRAAVTQRDWKQKLRAMRIPLGAVVSRRLHSAKQTTQLQGAPDGEYVVIEYHTSFEHKQTAIENFVSERDKGGQWRASGYFFK